MSDYDHRQYQLMLEQLDQFESKRIDLNHLVKGLEALLGTLEQVGPKWKSDFQRQWGVLEDVYADALDRRYTELPDSHKKLIANAVDKLKTMVTDALQNESA
jgi:hypothetical protein